MACVTNRLLYDPTDANSIAASSTIGAYVLAGDDGSPIGSTSNALDVNVAGFSATDLDIRTLQHDFDANGDSVRLGDGTNFLTSTNVSADYGLDVYLINTSIAVTATDLDIRDLSASQDNVAISDGTDTLAVNADGSINSVVTATQLDIDDLNATDDAVQAWCFDGSGNAIGSTTGSLDVNVTNSIDLDDDLADTAIENTATAVSTSAVNVVSSALANRKWLAVANEGNKLGYFGKTGVTTSNGFPLHQGMQQVWRIGPSVAPQFIGGTGASSEDYRVMELS